MKNRFMVGNIPLVEFAALHGLTPEGVRNQMKTGRCRIRLTTRPTDYPEYAVWEGMLSRTTYSKDRKSIENYQNRNIKVCDRWFKFSNFILDMGRRPSESHSIDRIDNTKGYSPDNCRWVTKDIQERNKRPKGRSRFKGLEARKNGSWSTRIKVGDRRIGAGTYRCEVEAAKARDIALMEHGIFEGLNFEWSVNESGHKTIYTPVKIRNF